MSIAHWDTHNGKVVSNVCLINPSPGGKKEYAVSIQFKDGTGLTLKSENNITIEETK
jgi:hypothetical protein